MKKILTLLILLSFTNGIACIWDSDTIRDEVNKKASAYDLIMGQVPHHGANYYKKRIEALDQKDALEKNDKQDLAAAYIRLADYSKAEKVLKKLYEAHPNDYAINSNLAVLYKKIDDYDKSYAFIKRALEIKPEGHMGLGDWYWRRIDYSRKLVEKPIPDLNFLGEEYSDFSKLGNHRDFDGQIKERARYLTQLILNDKDFADGYLVLGDLLWQIGDLNLALRAFLKARHLEHPNEDEVNNRIDAVIQQFRKAKRVDPPKRLAGFEKFRNFEVGRFNEELKNAEKWLASFEQTESELVSLTNFPSLVETEAKMEIKRFYP